LRSICACLKGVAAALLLLVAALSFASSTGTTTKPAAKSSVNTVHHSTKSTRKGKKSRSTVVHKRGQQNIDSARAQQIQEALVREHYLSGKPSGIWDAASQQAMQKYQADNGWQSKTTPDSRALIKLGLGPDQQHLLNPESAMTSNPQAAQGVPDPSKVSEPSPVKPQNQ
jgi:hypothetical protein